MPRSTSLTLGVAIVLLGLALAASGLDAHTRSQSFSHWQVQGEAVHLRFHVKSVQVTRLQVMNTPHNNLESLMAWELGRTVKVASEGGACAADADRKSSFGSSRSGGVWAEMWFRCKQPVQQLILEMSSFYSVAPSHLHFARINIDGQRHERVFTDGERVATIDFKSDPQADIWRYLTLGVEHILGGIDHLAFVLGLLLVCGITRQLPLAITGFTLGHSITLVLTVLDVLRPHGDSVEALIGFSVLLMGLQWGMRNLPADESERYAVGAGFWLLVAAGFAVLVPAAALTWWQISALGVFATCYLLLVRRHDPLLTVTTLFGLVHGFGFAGVLQEIGLPPEQLVLSLLAFNVGIEMGQLLFVGALCALLLAVRRALGPDSRDRVLVCTAGLLCALGSFWFVDRALLA